MAGFEYKEVDIGGGENRIKIGTDPYGKGWYVTLGDRNVATCYSDELSVKRECDLRRLNEMIDKYENRFK